MHPAYVALFVCLTAAALATGGSAKAADSSSAVIEQPDIPYCERDTVKTRLDLYLPSEKTNRARPGVLLIHGGGWSAGERGQWRKLARYLAGYGYVCASAGYRLAPAVDALGMIADVRTAMEWLKAHADEYGLDPQRIGAVGSSAGGHLVALLASIAPGDSLGDPEHGLRFDTRPRAVACYNPVLDLIAEERIKDNLPKISKKQGAAARADYILLSPARRVSAGMPPFLFLYGDKDTLTPVENCRAMLDSLTARGIPVRVEMFEGMEHGFGYSLEPGESYRAATVVADFFDRRLAR